MEIENKYSFEKALKDGINLFVGAGFSTEAWDAEGEKLPVGSALAKELAKAFDKGDYYSLPQISSILENSSKEDFYQYLEKRFTVSGFSPLYNGISHINVKSIYTTNIDDLIYKIYSNNKYVYIRDQVTLGVTNDERAVHYLPLHGCIKTPERGYVFDVNALANIYSDVPRIWSCLSRELEIRPTVFIGYGFSDSSVIQALTSKQTFGNVQKEKWVVLRDQDHQYEEFYKSQGFSIIKANLDELLKYFMGFKQEGITTSLDDERRHLLKPYFVPNSISEVKVQRPIKDFFTGSDPYWCDIISNQIYKTQYFSKIQNSVNNPNKNTVIIGAPVSGKTTLMMQVASAINFDGIKLFFSSLSEERANYIVKLIGDDKALVCVDNLYDSIESVSILNRPNITVLFAERSHYFSIISHLIDRTKYEVINVTSLSDNDLQGVFNSLPNGIRNIYLKKESPSKQYGKDSVFEFVLRNVNLPNIKERYISAIKKLEEEDSELAEFIVLCAYMHSCRIPLSVEMAYDYFDYYDFKDVFDLKNDAADIIKDYLPVEKGKYEDMDYYYPRSIYIAETIVDACSSETLKRVLNTVISNIPPFRICDYKKFRKYGFDKNLVIKAFPIWNEGKSFYEKAFLYDSKNPYVLQQGALYLAYYRQYGYAFQWIDRAINMTNDKYFSIRNSHAYIKFNANIDKKGEAVRAELDNSMSILERCINNDARKKFHALTYGQQAIRYAIKYSDEQSKDYLNKAKRWIERELKESSWDKELADTKSNIVVQLDRIE